MCWCSCIDIQKSLKKVEKIKDMYLGKKFSNSDVKKEIKKFKIKNLKKI